ncbi:MAG: MBOAT family O-acyltransferase [Candidatus Binatia bacterium]|nr:MBOAT family O-acyltransferase [Candidatus Binatia bacterium]
MSIADALSWLQWEFYDLAVGAWETRHSLFMRFSLFGALLAALVVAASALPARVRVWVLVAASLASIALLGSPLLAGIALAFSIVLHTVIERVPGPLGTGLSWGLIVALAAYPALLPADILVGNTSDMAEFWAFATNVWWLRCVAYVVDRRARNVPARPLHEFLTATLFFPTFVNGPIETTEQLAEHRRKGPVVDTWDELRAYAARLLPCAGRFGWGMGKVLLATFYLGQDNDTIFATSGTSVGHVRLWLWAAELYFTFYVIFSGWTDISVSLARVIGFDIGENFDKPWKSRSVGEFWRRWHMSFGIWLRNYVYIPLGGNRRHAALNVLLTFLASGLWHVWGALKVLGIEGYPPIAWTGFIVWGLLNGGAQIAARQWNNVPALAPVRTLVRTRIPAPLRDRANQAMAFGFVAMAWIPFFLPPWIAPDTFWRIFQRMFYLA